MGMHRCFVALDLALAGLFDPEHRFMGHVTIARTRRMPMAVRQAVASLEVPRLRIEATGFSLCGVPPGFPEGSLRDPGSFPLPGPVAVNHFLALRSA